MYQIKKSNKFVNKIPRIVILVFVGVVFCVFVVPLFRDCYTLRTIKTRITGVEVKEPFYMVYTENMTFIIEDSYYFYRFNSSDVYGKIKAEMVNKDVVITYYGWRLPIMSWYPNLMSAETIENGQ